MESFQKVGRVVGTHQSFFYNKLQHSGSVVYMLFVGTEKHIDIFNNKSKKSKKQQPKMSKCKKKSIYLSLLEQASAVNIPVLVLPLPLESPTRTLYDLHH